MGLNGNQFTDEIKERLTFDKESHLKKKLVEEISNCSNTSSEEFETDNEDKSFDSMASYSSVQRTQHFRRKFKNVDMTSCWLNSCLQLILIALDHYSLRETLNSELGLELLKLRSSDQHISLDS